MGEPRNPSNGMTTPISQPPPPPAPPSKSRSIKKNKQKVFRVVRSVFHSLPVINPSALKLSTGVLLNKHRESCSSNHVTGTLFGYKKGLVSLSIQETPGTFPMLILELGLETTMLQREMGKGLVRIVLECEKRPDKEKIKIVDEPSWKVFCNGKKGGNGVKREATTDDLRIIEMLRMVSMGAGMLPGNPEVEGPNSDMAYVRAHFDRVVGCKDSETLYMMSPDRNNGLELSIFFVRV
uniref:protein MIZU-KUSSEI 1-like n=1 Tax=Erigeron canadensis TaxID=72917 RepID=UPI001CB8F04C|nr:protein MIZU-KUSSEI 1-like [Erigeron canadensis]